MLSRISSVLTDDEERIVGVAIGCFLAVHREIGPGMSENVYSKASAIELRERGIPFEAELVVPILYKGHLLCHHRLDLLVAGCLVVEMKAVEAIHPVHVAQATSYLRATRCRVALIVNFNVELLKNGIRRVVL